MSVNERLADAAHEEIRPEAERVLSERQHAAETARAALGATREATRTRQAEPERTRARDLAFEF